MFVFLLLKLKNRCSFKFINFVEQKTIKKKVQRKVNINKRAKMQTFKLEQIN